MEPWKEQFFESYYGQSSGLSLEDSRKLTSATSDPKMKKSLTEQPKPTPPSDEPPIKTVVAAPEAESKPVLLLCPVRKESGVSPEEVLPEPSKSPEPLVSSTSSVIEQDRTGPIPGPEDEDPLGQRKPVTSAEPKPENENHLTIATPIIKENKGTAVLTPSKPKSPGIGKPIIRPVIEASPQENTVTVASPSEHSDLNPEGLKRKSSLTEEETPVSWEKRPRVLENHQHQQALQASQQPFPIRGERVQVRKVPPLKIPVSRISHVPFPTGQVSPRVRFPALDRKSVV